MIHILDAGPMVAYLSSEKGATIVADILADNLGECYAHFFNLTEIYYIYFRRGGVAQAEAALKTLMDAGVIPCYDHDNEFWKESALFKGRHPMSLPDAFCLTLARGLTGTVVTTDHGEFDALVPLGYAPIFFIR